MLVLILGVVLFLATHSVRIVAADGRERLIARLGAGPYKALNSVFSLASLVLMVWGYGLARQDPVILWDPPLWTKHIAVTLNLLAFILLALFIVPAGRLKPWLGHPMTLAVKVWAFAHLIANGTLADVILFGALLAWAIALYAVCRRRDRAAGVVRAAGPAHNDLLALVLGAVLWAAIVWWLHGWLIGVSPLA